MARKIFNKHYSVIDLETLATGSDAVILTLGLTFGEYDAQKTFQQLVDDGLYLKFDIKEQLDRGRKKSARVINWWREQSAEARSIIIPKADDISLYGLKTLMIEFYANKGVDIKNVDFYDRNCFDLSKLQFMVEEELNEDVFWDYHQTFDVATAFRFLGMDRYAGLYVSDIPGAIYHNALHDAAVDHLRLQKSLHSLGE